MYNIYAPPLFSSFSPAPTNNKKQLLYADLSGNISWKETNVANGIVQLDSGNKISDSLINLKLVFEDTSENFIDPLSQTVEAEGQLFITKDTNKIYRYQHSGTEYVQIASGCEFVDGLPVVGINNTLYIDVGNDAVK